MAEYYWFGFIVSRAWPGFAYSYLCLQIHDFQILDAKWCRVTSKQFWGTQMSFGGFNQCQRWSHNLFLIVCVSDKLSCIMLKGILKCSLPLLIDGEQLYEHVKPLGRCKPKFSPILNLKKWVQTAQNIKGWYCQGWHQTSCVPRTNNIT